MKKLILSIIALCGMMSAQAQRTDFARGADISWATEMEADGVKFCNAEGTETDIFALMKQIGMNAIRLRVWVNPASYGYGAWCDKADVLAKARRAHAQGLDLMIDFHYSDFFADPSRQNTPVDWAGYTLEQVKTAVANHTTDVLQALKSEGITVKWVQVGNETNSGMVWDTGKIDWTKSGSARYTDYVAVSNAGYDAVKAIMPSVPVIVHVGSTDLATWFYQEFKNAGGKFDMIGLSHYPTADQWNSTASDAKYSNIYAASQVTKAATALGVPVMISETGFQSDKPALASLVMKDLFRRMTAISQCKGIFYWEPQVDGAWKPTYYNTNNWGAYEKGAFTTNMQPMATLDAFAADRDYTTSGYPSELKIYDKDGVNILATLTKTGDGIYSGQLNDPNGWLNFYIADEENAVYYGSLKSDKTKLSATFDSYYNFWIDNKGTAGVYDLQANLSTMTWTHTYNAAATAGLSAVTGQTDAAADSRYYTLGGIRMEGKPAKQGVYIHQGKKVVR